MKKFLAVLLLTLLSVFSTYAQTQSSQPKTITLNDALAIAFDRNVTVAQAVNGVDEANAGVTAAYGLYAPKVIPYAYFKRNGSNTPATVQTFGNQFLPIPAQDIYQNQYSYGVSASYTLFDGFNRESIFSSARAGAAQANQGLDRTRQSIANSVISAYLAVIQNEQQVKVLQDNVTNERNLLDRISEQNRLGAVAIGDVYRQQSVLAQAEYSLISGQNQYDKSKADLLNLLALNVDQEYTIADPSIATQIKQVETDPGVQSMGSFDDLFKRALAARPDYMSTQESVTLANLGVTEAWSAYYPSLNLVGSLTSTSPEWATASQWGSNHASSVGLTLSWQMPEIFSAVQKIEVADITQKNAVLQMQQKGRDISVELKKALLDLEAARKQYVASQRSQLAAEQDRKTAEAKYNLGSGTLLDFQVADATYLTAQLTTLANAYNYMALKSNLDLVIGEKKY